MKKSLARLLTVLLCCGMICGSLLACGADKSDRDILNTWTSMEGHRYTFNENGSGTFCIVGSEYEITWKYDSELKAYIIASSRFGTQTVTMKEEGETKYLTSGGKTFVTPSAFEKKLPAHLDACRALLAEELVIGEKMMLNQEYTTETLAAVFNLKIDENGTLCLRVLIKNDGSVPITLDNFGSDDCPIYVGYGVSCYNTGEKQGSIGGFGLKKTLEGGIDAIEPGNSGTIRIELVDNANWLLQTYGTLIGYVSCSIEDDTQNDYLNFEDCFGS